MDDSGLEMLQKVRWGKEAHYFVPMENERTLGMPLLDESMNEPISISAKILDRKLRLDMVFEKTKKGALLLTLPMNLTLFQSDPHDGSDKGMGPELYTELRISGIASPLDELAGIASGDIRYELVLKGRSNICVGPKDLHGWRLRILGPELDLALFGNLYGLSDEAIITP